MTDDFTRTPQAPAVGGARGLVLRPFRGVRFATSDPVALGALTSPPYDLIDDTGVERLMAADPHNVVRLILPRAHGGGDRYQHAATTLRRWLEEGVLVTDPEPALYVYEERSDGQVQRGLIGGVGLAGYDAGVVLPHENVMPGPVQDRLHLMRATAANLEPIFLLYSGAGAASRLVEKVASDRTPTSVATDGGTAYRLWRVTDPGEQAAVDADLRRHTALIADGHHRYATYLRLRAEYHAAGRGPGPWDYGLALLVDETAYPARLGAIHRVLPGLPPDRARKRAAEAFRLRRASDDLGVAMDELASAAARGPAFLLAGDGRQDVLTDPDLAMMAAAIPKDHSRLWRRLPTTVLRYLLIEAQWGITEDERSVLAMHHEPGTAVKAAAAAGGTAVLLEPLHIADVRGLAEAGERVPRKSTSFGPKPRNGLVMRTLTDG